MGLLFSANPFARMFTAAMGGGDEMVVAQRIVGAESRTPALRIVVLLFVLGICGTACVAAWRAMSELKRRGLWFTALLLWPMILTGVALFVVGNRLLAAGVLREPVIAGAPLLVILVSAISAALAAATLGWLRNDSR